MLPTHSFEPIQRENSFHVFGNKCSISFKTAVRWTGIASLTLGLLWLLSWNVYLGPPPPSEPLPLRPTITDSWDDRKNQVKDAFLHAYGGYMKHAFPHDELTAISGQSSDGYNGWGVTVFDSLDTMWIMGLKTEFYEAVKFVRNHNFETVRTDKHIPFFETVIRYLGGLLSAHALSNETVLLEKANELGTILLPAFNTPSGFPSYSVNTKTGDTTFQQGSTIVAEIASCQLEFKYLSKLTGNAEYYEKAEKVMTRLYDENVTNGLFPETWSMEGKPINTHYTAGANVDSGYEYLLKQYLLTGDTKARDQYIKSMDGIINNLLYITSHRNLLYVTDLHDNAPAYRLEHLSCFLPGLLALGAHTLDLLPDVKRLHEWAAKGLTNTCWVTYADQGSGLGPDIVQMFGRDSTRWVEKLKEWVELGEIGDPPGVGDVEPVKDGKKMDYFYSVSGYYLRPETIESMYLMWKTTGDSRWRERGYEIFTSIEKHAKTEFGYASLQRVDRPPYYKVDNMPSWFLAETLKYLYLLFDDNDPIDLKKWVFNTEAHPFPVFE